MRETFVDREENPAHNGPDGFHRLHIYMTRRSGAETDAWLSESFAAFAAEDVVQKGQAPSAGGLQQ